VKNEEKIRRSTASMDRGCPLCRAMTSRETERLELRRVVSDWHQVYGIDISAEFEGYESAVLRQCGECHLEFFDPPLAGSGRMYSQLQRFDWYYMSGKWEYEVATEDLMGKTAVLEVGCGKGEFVDRLHQERGIEAMGIELNPEAVKEGKGLGRKVEQVRVEELADTHGGQFDAVCSFQVLEHVPDARGFLEACVRLLRPGGCLLLGVPNNESYIRHARNDLLNQPPHHVSRWSKRVFEAIPRVFPLQLTKVLNEPLAPYHIGPYFHIQATRFCRNSRVGNLVGKLLEKTLAPSLVGRRWNRYFRGHSMYVNLVRVGEKHWED
jgi:2-polyprenyl-3-methyl-5-hydroxy-6-metoxy-1,4-benzoquinol methylase